MRYFDFLLQMKGGLGSSRVQSYQVIYRSIYTCRGKKSVTRGVKRADMIYWQNAAQGIYTQRKEKSTKERDIGSSLVTLGRWCCAISSTMTPLGGSPLLVRDCKKVATAHLPMQTHRPR